MNFIADFHIHSKYSRATSKSCDLEHLNVWAKRKGIQVVGTGDFTHPAWLGQIREKLEPAEEGLYTLKDEFQKGMEEEYIPQGMKDVRFILTVEISSIYKKNDRVRKVHNVIFAPDLKTAEKIAARLDAIGNVKSDGRPILGLDSKDLLEIVLESSEKAFLVPAHIWTPHFSVLGAKSGFDTLEECFEDLTEHIFAVETGLSSDPPMNWRLKQLDNVVLISNSDAHSPGKLGREANIFDTDISYPAMRSAMKDKDKDAFKGTIEFFPEEGKYHYDGHRNCSMRMTPEETIAADGLCPVCGKKVTMGVMHRVAELADRLGGRRPRGKADFINLIPLQEVLSEILGKGPNTKTVMKEYFNCLKTFGPELVILRETPIDKLNRLGPPLLGQALKKMRKGEVKPLAGYDGEFGVISIFSPKEREKLLQKAQKTLF